MRIFGYFLQEKEIARVETQIANIRSGNLSEESDDLAKLLIDNSKLKFRLEILHRVSYLQSQLTGM